MSDDDGRWQESDVGTIAACGCEVTRANIPCGDAYQGTDDEGRGHDYPDTGCGDCQFGIPAVRHECAEAP